jgi:putative copper resistance protein D
MHHVLILIFGFHYAATMALFGGALFRRLVPADPPIEGENRTIGRWLTGCAVVALASAIALILLEAGAMAGDWAAATDPAVIRKVIAGTAFGQVWLLRVVLNLGAILLAAAPERRGTPRIGIDSAAAALLATLALTGHAYALGGSYLPFNQAIHLLATGAWVGGVPVLTLRLRGLRRDYAAATRCLYRFSGYGALNVAVIVVTGVINSVALAGTSLSAFGSDYGHALLAKLVLVAAMVAVAFGNRFWLLPALAKGDERAARRLRGLVYAESALGAAVVLVACLLGSLPPPAT